MATETPRNPGGDSTAPPHTQTVNRIEGGAAPPASDRPAAALVVPPDPQDDADADFDDDDELSLGG